MDNLTHSLLGVVLSRAGLNRFAPQGGWLCLAAASAPDLDIVSWAAGPTAYLEYHRGWTHAFAFAPVVALAPLLLWRLLVRKPELRRGRWPGAYLVSLVCVLSHHLLDWLNVYGIRLIQPFSSAWLRLDLVHIVDIWIWALLLAGVLAPMLVRLVNSEIGARSGPGRAGAWTILLLLSLYLFGRWDLHERAVATLESRRYGPESVRRAAAFPGAANPWHWTGLVETDSEYRVFDINLLGEFDPDAARVFYKPPPSAAFDSARGTAVARDFLLFAQFPVWRLTPASQPEGGTLVTLSDLRFGLPGDGRFQASILLDSAQRPLRESFSFGTMKQEGRP
jgi:inner membrane protein